MKSIEENFINAIHSDRESEYTKLHDFVKIEGKFDFGVTLQGGVSAILIAAWKGKTDILETLLDILRDSNLKSMQKRAVLTANMSNGMSSVSVAKMTGNTEILKLIFKSAEGILDAEELEKFLTTKAKNYGAFLNIAKDVFSSEELEKMPNIKDLILKQATEKKPDAPKRMQSWAHSARSKNSTTHTQI